MSEYVTWSRLLEWAKAHGAINDRIIEMKIGTRHINGEVRGVVTIVGHAEDENGKPYAIALEQGPALWSITAPLRSLP